MAGIPGILVGISTEHLYSHQNRLVGADIQSKILVHELFHPFHLTEMNLKGGNEEHLLSPVEIDMN